MQSAELPQVTEFKYLHPAERWWHAYRSEQEDTVLMEQLEEDVWRPTVSDIGIPLPLKDTQYDCSASYTPVLHGMETVPTTSSHMKKLEVTEVKMRGWGHILRDHLGSDNIRERLKVGNITERYRKGRLRWLVCIHGETRPRVCRKKHTGTTWEKKTDQFWSKDVWQTLAMVPPGRRRDGWTVSTETWDLSVRQ